MVEKTCGGCTHYLAAVVGGERAAGGTCHLKPPVPLLIGVENTPMGPRPAVIPWRPVVGETEKACGDYLIPLSDIRIGDLALAALDTEATKQ